MTARNVAMLSILFAIIGLVMSGSRLSSAQVSLLSFAQQAPSLQTAEGQVTQIDAQNNFLQIQTSAGQEMQFAFNDRTEVVTSAQLEVGTTVRISYIVLEGTMVAVRIEEA